MKKILHSELNKTVIKCCLKEQINFQVCERVQLLVPSFGYPPPPRKCSDHLFTKEKQEKN